MLIKELTVKNFRNLDCGKAIQLHPKINFISGKNGSGKTALLEAIFYLGRGKSFRENQTKFIINDREHFFQLTAKIIGKNASHFLGIERGNKSYQLRLDGESLQGLSELASFLPIQIINSDNFALISAGPDIRRQFMDYGLFYSQQSFLKSWRKYQYALKNRNAALRNDWPRDQFAAWNQMIAESAAIIDKYRKDYLQALEEKLNYYHVQLGGLAPLNIRYYCGWNKEYDLKDLLGQHIERDRQLKYTREGIHRSEWRILTGEQQDVAHHYSRGQQKTVICALILAQADLIAKAVKKKPILLIDDISAELDEHRRGLLMDFLINSGSQLFVSNIKVLAEYNKGFHFQLVEGKIQKVED